MNRPFRMPLVFALAALGLLVCFFLIRKALLPFFVATVLAYLLAPLVRMLSRRIARGWAVVTVLCLSMGGFGLAAAVLLPMAWEQVVRALRSLPQWRGALEVRFGPWLGQHPDLQARLRSLLDTVSPEDLLKGLQSAGAGLMGAFLNTLALLLVPVILYYLLLEGPSFLAAAESLIPPRFRRRVQRFAEAVHQRIGGYIRGQLAVAMVMTLLQGLLFVVMGVPNAVMLGLVAGFANFVPYSPYILALVPAMVLTALAGAGWGKVALLAGLFTVVQKAETLYFTPVWVGRATRLHPLEVLLAFLAFGFLFGILGLVFAVPLMIVVRVASEQFLADYRNHAWFRGEDA